MSTKTGLQRIFLVLTWASMILWVILSLLFSLGFLDLLYSIIIKNNGHFQWELFSPLLPYGTYILAIALTLIITSTLAYITHGFLE